MPVLLQLVLISLFISACSTTAEFIEEDKVSVMTFNIRYGTAEDGENHWNKRKHMVFKVINDYAPDVLGMQEGLGFQIDEIIAVSPTYKSVGLGRDSENKGEFSNILYNNLKFDLIETDTFWLSETPETMSKNWGNGLHRICTWVLLKNKVTDKNIYVFNTHFDHKSVLSRAQSAQLIVDKIQRRTQSNVPFILTGDFNVTLLAPEMHYFGLNNIHDTDSLVEHDDLNRGTFSGFNYAQYERKIDYIFIQRDQWTVKKSEIIRYSESEHYPSDHFPIYAELAQ